MSQVPPVPPTGHFAFPSAMRPMEQREAGGARSGSRRRGSSSARGAGGEGGGGESSARPREAVLQDSGRGSRGGRSSSEEAGQEALAGAVAAALLPHLQALRPGGGPNNTVSPRGNMVSAAVENQLAARLRALEQLEERAARATGELERMAEAAAAAVAAQAAQAQEATTVMLPLEKSGSERSSSETVNQPSASPWNKPRRLRHSSTSCNGGDISKEFLDKAFVVNFRRLMVIMKACEIIHELIKSTAIAALTLVGASNFWELGYSLVFVFILLFLFVLNTTRMNHLDSDKHKKLADLLEDDDPDPDSTGPDKWDNPNRYLKALMLQRGGSCLRRFGRRRRAFLGMLLFTILCGACWAPLMRDWVMDDVFNDARYGGEESMRFFGALLLVGTLMLFFYAAFEAMYWRETQSVMPMKWDGERHIPWDVKKHGVPPQFRWFGLPSMWFSSEKAKSDLILWANLATTTYEQQKEGKTVDKLYPEELAVLSLDSRALSQLSCTLKKAKLYRVNLQYGSGRFLTRRPLRGALSKELPEPRKVELGEVPEELGMHLIFFDAQGPAYHVAEANSQERPRGQVHLLRGHSMISTATDSPRARRGGGDGSPDMEGRGSRTSPTVTVEAVPTVRSLLTSAHSTPKERGGLSVRFNSKASEHDFAICDQA